MALQAMLADCYSLDRPGLICDARCRMATFRTTVERRTDDLDTCPSQAGAPGPEQPSLIALQRIEPGALNALPDRSDNGAPGRKDSAVTFNVAGHFL
jgi:hypothetical protein